MRQIRTKKLQGIIIIFLLLHGSAAVLAQDIQRQAILSASGWYEQGSYQLSNGLNALNGSTSSADISIDLAYGLGQSWALGLFGNYQREQLIVENALFNSATSARENYRARNLRWMIGPQLQYYVPLSNVFVLRLQGQVGLGQSDNYFTENDTAGVVQLRNEYRTLTGLELQGLFMWRPVKSVGVFAGLTYYNRIELFEVNNSGGVVLTESFNGYGLRIGLSMFINKNHLSNAPSKPGYIPRN